MESNLPLYIIKPFTHLFLVKDQLSCYFQEDAKNAMILTLPY